MIRRLIKLVHVAVTLVVSALSLPEYSGSGREWAAVPVEPQDTLFSQTYTDVDEWWDTGDRKSDFTSPVIGGGIRVAVLTTHHFNKAGTCFAALRGISQWEGEAMTPYARIENMGWARVVVR
jgi:hypothetical protein